MPPKSGWLRWERPKLGLAELKHPRARVGEVCRGCWLSGGRGDGSLGANNISFLWPRLMLANVAGQRWESWEQVGRKSLVLELEGIEAAPRVVTVAKRGLCRCS